MTMKWEENDLVAPLARARGLGSARDGVKHWIQQRITAVANVVLVPWFIVSMVLVIREGGDYDTVVKWLWTGINPVMMILLVASVFYHAKLGLQIVIEDYVHAEGAKFLTLVIAKLLLAAGVVACIFSILKIVL